MNLSKMLSISELVGPLRRVELYYAIIFFSLDRDLLETEVTQLGRFGFPTLEMCLSSGT